MQRMRTQITPLLLAAIIAAASAPPVRAADRQTLDRSAAEALANLTTSNAAAKLLAGQATAVLIFPHIVKAGFLFGGQLGDKPGQHIVYISAELSRLCWARVSPSISILDLSRVGGLILPLRGLVAHRNDVYRVQSI